MTATIKINGLKELQVKLKALPKKLETDVDMIVQDHTRQMVVNAQKDAPVDQNTIRRGITAKKNGTANWSMVSIAVHSPFIEFGTKSRFQPIPGVDASQFKGSGGKEGGKGFYDSILEWVKRKKIAGTYSDKTGRRTGSKVDRQLEDEQAAWAIYLSIVRHGVKPHPFFFKQGPRQEPLLVAELKALLNEQSL